MTTPISTPELSITDLQNLRKIIDTSVQRGAFAAHEFSAIGAVYDRLNSFLNAVAPQETAQPVVESDAQETL